MAGKIATELKRCVGALFDDHRADHAGQIAKIRKAAGRPEAT